MNKAKLKTYAPQARKDFIAAVTQRANLLGLSESAGKFEALPAERRGDVVLIAGREWPARVAQQRERLVRRIQRDGFGYTMEAVAYTWFNRFAALRYMELHDYLGHGHRVLSSATAGGLPDILAHAADLAASRELPGLDTAHIAELKLAGNKDGELYRLLLVAQCNALSTAMPFLFERIDDETELLLPDNLLRTDSVIAKLVAEIPEEDWAEVEIIGWLYQFYISEKKDQVIGKVVKSEDIPAATQLFTPNWIVQYLVQNSVGRLWLMANPASTLKSEWPYYIEPAEQTPEVNAQLDALIQTRMAEDGGSLNPESITVLDPACGSGHILVEAYALLKGIYLERGYRLRDIPRLILEKNLYGLDIDDRAAQLAGFALLMKACADDRRLFNDPPRLKVLSLQESKGLDPDELATHLAPFGVQRGTVKALLDTFEHAKTFGSLIQIPDVLNAQLPALAEALGKANETGDLYSQAAAQDLMALVAQARVLGQRFDAVVANPPWMGYRGINDTLKDYLAQSCPLGRLDLQTAFLELFLMAIKPSGFVSMILRHNWMFITTFEDLRSFLIRDRFMSALLHIEEGGWSSYGTSAINVMGASVGAGSASYAFVSKDDEKDIFNGSMKGMPLVRRYCFTQSDFVRLPSLPFAYWSTKSDLLAFKKGVSFESVAPPRQGMATTDNNTFVRYWYEVAFDNIAFDVESVGQASARTEKWFPYNKGGGYRKWYGNQLFVVNYQDNGRDIKNRIVNFYKQSISRRITNTDYFFKEAITWSDIGSDNLAARYNPSGFIFDVTGMSCFPIESRRWFILSLLCSKVMTRFMSILNPTLHFQVGDMARVPVLNEQDYSHEISENGRVAVELSKKDWDQFEISWGFKKFGLARPSSGCNRLLSESWTSYVDETEERISQLHKIEEENNRLLIEAYGLNEEISPDIPKEKITLSRADREKDSQRLISYAIGCMMGR
ncbi:MAG: BREX-1 system adenine-specific DNA-methyltransferase PglX, partial [Rhodocyclaceae bacterium]